MKIKSIFKWTLRLVLIALLCAAIAIFIAYWRSTNDCERYSAVPANPMKAVIHCEYGKPEVLEVKDLEKPTPDDNQLLVRVRAASLNPLDGHFVRGMLLARAICATPLTDCAKIGPMMISAPSEIACWAAACAPCTVPPSSFTSN